MDCSEELLLIERGLQSAPGLLSLEADFVGRRLHFDSQLTSAVALAGQITTLGFPAEVPLNVVSRPLSALPMLQPTTLVAGGLLALVGVVVLLRGAESHVAWWLAVASAVVSAEPAEVTTEPPTADTAVITPLG